MEASELTPGSLWNEVAGRLRGALNDATYRTWFGEVRATEERDALVLAVPNNFTREWIEGHFLDLIRAAVRDASGGDRVVVRLVVDDSLASRRRGAASARADGRHQPEVHVRPLRHRLVEPFRARSSSGCSRDARPGVQPALHLRGNRPRQDAPAPGDRPLHHQPRQPAVGALRHERDVHERLHQLASRPAASRASSSAIATTTCS